MPVYNGEDYLGQAIDCVLDQTFRNFEFIIINDGSTDSSAGIIKRYNDPRIRYYEHENRGLAATLNRGIELSRGKYIARQDQDDISLPKRFEKQIDFLEKNQDYGMVGTWAQIWIGNKKTDREHRHSADNLHLQFDLLFSNPFVHSSMMVRRRVFEEIGTYSTDKDRQPPEDYELWSRIARKFKVGNIPEMLQIYREIPTSMSRDTSSPMLDRAVTISRENILLVLAGACFDVDVNNLAALSFGQYHLLVKGHSLRKLFRTINRTASRLSDQHKVPRNRLAGRLKAHFGLIRNRYLSYRYERTWKLMKKVTGHRMGD